MAVGTSLLLAVNCAFGAARWNYYSRGPAGSFVKRLRVSIPSWEDDIDFSGVSVEEGKWWVSITATFDHASTSHLVNNMVMLLSFAPQLEETLGAAAVTGGGDSSSDRSRILGALLVWLLFALTGAAGWLLTLLRLKRQHRGEDWAFAARYQVSVGSSPATYGMLAFLAAVNPEHCVRRFAGLPPWLWVTALLCGPQLFSEKYGVQWWSSRPLTRPDTASAAASSSSSSSMGGQGGAGGGSHDPAAKAEKQRRWWNWRCPPFAALGLLFGWAVLRPLLAEGGDSAHSTPDLRGGGGRGRAGGSDGEQQCAVTSAGYFTVYFGYLALLKAADVCWLRRSFFAMPGSDHACHLGGALCGASLGTLLLATGLSGPSPWWHGGGAVGNDGGAHGDWGSTTAAAAPATGRATAHVFLAVVVLVARLALEF